VAAAAREVWQYLEQRRSSYLANFAATDIDWAIQNGRIVEQATQMATGAVSRDQSMAANIDWILQQNPPGTKMVLWAHNMHIAREAYGAMGEYLARAHDIDYLPVAQLFHSGSYNAYSGGHLGANAAVPSYPGTLEYVLHSAGMPRLVLDLRKLATDDPGSAWLLGDMEWRSIGAMATNVWSQTGTLVWNYDAVIFFDQTTPSALLPFTAPVEMY
jgi:erythromycin esterase